MRSIPVGSNTKGTPGQYNDLLADAAGAGRLLAHQMLGYFTLSTNPANGKTLTLDINGTNVVLTFVSTIGSTAGNVLIGATAAATCANLLNLLNNPTVTNANQVAIGVNTSANVTLVNYLDYFLVGTTLYISSINNLVSAPLTSFSGSTNATSDSYTAQTMALFVEPGVVFINGTEVYFAGGITPTVTAPTGGNNRIDVLTIDNTGTLAWTTGTAASSPTTPTYPANKLPICELYNVTGETALYDNANQQTGAGYILNDVRPFLAYPIPIGAIPDNVLPATDATYNLGSASFRWATGYFSSGVFVAGNAIASARFGGNGSSGALTSSSGNTTVNAANAAIAEVDYSSITLTGSASLVLSNPNTNGTILYVRSQGNVTLSATTAINMSSMGATGGAAQSSQNTAGNPGTAAIHTLGFLGPVSGAGGNSSGTAGTAPAAYFALAGLIAGNRIVSPGAGGASGGSSNIGGATSTAGGTGGGAIIIECAGAYNFTGGMTTAGATGGNAPASKGSGGSGGGGGGDILVLYNTLTANSGTYTQTGGSGGSGTSQGGAGTGGGGGAGGTGGSVNAGSSGTAGSGSTTGGNGGNGGNGSNYVMLNTYFA